MLIQRPQETETVIRPVRLLTVGEQERAPAPLVRVMTCGLLTLEIAQEMVSADPPRARYAVLTPDRLRGRGVGPALSLLKLLVSRPQRFAPADWLLEQFCRGEGEAFSSKRLDTLAWLLRDLLCPPGYEFLRRQVVAHTRAMSGVAINSRATRWSGWMRRRCPGTWSRQCAWNASGTIPCRSGSGPTNWPDGETICPTRSIVSGRMRSAKKLPGCGGSVCWHWPGCILSGRAERAKRKHWYSCVRIGPRIRAMRIFCVR